MVNCRYASFRKFWKDGIRNIHYANICFHYKNRGHECSYQRCPYREPNSHYSRQLKRVINYKRWRSAKARTNRRKIIKKKKF